jgi:hypothetical protein
MKTQTKNIAVKIEDYTIAPRLIEALKTGKAGAQANAPYYVRMPMFYTVKRIPDRVLSKLNTTRPKLLEAILTVVKSECTAIAAHGEGKNPLGYAESDPKLRRAFRRNLKHANRKNSYAECYASRCNYHHSREGHGKQFVQRLARPIAEAHRVSELAAQNAVALFLDDLDAKGRAIAESLLFA